MSTFGQSVYFKPTSYSADAFYFTSHGMRFTMDAEGHMQDKLVFYSYNIYTGDTSILFESNLSDNCIKGTATWYNYKGQLIRQVEADEPVGSVQPIAHSFTMPGHLRLTLSVVMEKSISWYENNPSLKEKEEFYKEGNLEKRILYYGNGNKKSEYNYAVNEKVSDYRNAGEGERWKFYGPCILYHRNGAKQEEGFKDGNSKMGLWKYYDENETVLKEEFYYTKDSASIKYFHPNGKTEMTYTMYHHFYIGDVYTYYETGEVETYTHYDQSGRSDTAKITYYPNGKMMVYSPCCGYRATGTVTRWHENGQKNWEYQVSDGYPVGAFTSWYSNGKIESKGQYDPYGNNIGIWNFYKENGKFDYSRNYSEEDQEFISEGNVTQEISFESTDEFSSSIEPRDFKYYFPRSGFLNTHVPVSKQNKLSVLEKYNTIEVEIKIDEMGYAVYTILTPMKEKQRIVLENFFRPYQKFDQPFRLLNNYVACTMRLDVIYEGVN
ncbi:MAG: hypothetical protein IPH24_02290 [Crocinitomicaceae bacterium]|nr:hypothetical protein [Crocinitomicaceae bacterium]